MPNWTGPYIGVGVGGAFATHDRSAKDVDELNGTVVDATRLWDDHHGQSHAFGTVTLGYDHQFSGRWSAVSTADYDFGNRNSHIAADTAPTCACARTDTWSIGGRLGVLASRALLFCQQAGLSFDRS
jgi:outer membrane immunogenic protein